MGKEVFVVLQSYTFFLTIEPLALSLPILHRTSTRAISPVLYFDNEYKYEVPKRALLAIAFSTVMVPYVVKAVALLVVFPIIWRLFKRLVLRSPLSKVAGPSSGSWWSGASSNLFLKLTAVWIDIWPGNILDLFSPMSWDFHEKLAKEYGGAVRVHGFFRVRLPEIMI